MARQNLERDIHKMDLEAIPTAVETRTEYDWMFGVPSREWKLVALLGVVYTRESIQSRYWISIQAIERYLGEFGYQPIVALQRAEQLLNTARYYHILAEDPALMALELLPRPLDAIAEFVGELDNFNMIHLLAAKLDELAFIPKPANSWR